MLDFPSGARVHAFQSEEAWLEYRRLRIGGSTMAAILGKSRWDSPFGVYTRLSGVPTPELEDNELLFWGRNNERAIARGHAILEGVALADMGPWTVVELSLPTGDSIYATLDFVRLSDDRRHPVAVTEAKNVDISQSTFWRPGVIGDGGEAPEEYVIQVRTGMLVTGLEQGELIALVGGNRRVVVQIPRDEAFEREMIEASQDMLRRVAAQDPPDMDGHEATRKGLRATYPDLDGERHVEFGDAEAILLAQRAKLLAEADDKTEKAKAIENMLIQRMGDARYATVPGWPKVTSVAPYEIAEHVTKARTQPRTWRFPKNPTKTKE